MDQVDFLVIGAGIAGLSAAIRLADTGRVLVVTKEELAESNTAYALKRPAHANHGRRTQPLADSARKR